MRGGVEGFALLSVEDASFSERTLHRIVLGLDRIGGGPGIFVQLPLDDELDALDAVLGVTVTF